MLAPLIRGAKTLPVSPPSLYDIALVACPHCDLLLRLPAVAAGASARCPRCDEVLWRPHRDSLGRSLALALAAAVLFGIANSAPMLGLSTIGRHASTTVIGGARHLWGDGEQIVAGLVLFAAVVAPAVQIGFMLLITIAARRERAPAWIAEPLRALQFTRTWSMIEVMLLGVLIALTKISDYATVIPGLALFALGALIVLLAAMQSCFDPREAWDRVAWVADAPEQTAEGPTP